MTRLIALALVLVCALCPAQWMSLSLCDLQAKPRWPWNGKVDITYSVDCTLLDKNHDPKDIYMYFEGNDANRSRTITLNALTGPGADGPIKAGGPYTITWDVSKDAPILNSSDFVITASAKVGPPLYLVIDLSGGPGADHYPWHYAWESPTAYNKAQTTELWLRYFPDGKFTMGSPEDELGRNPDETQHDVILTQDFYIGIFECTQKQWELVMGNNPSFFQRENYSSDPTDYSVRPVENVSYNTIRGNGDSYYFYGQDDSWPQNGHQVFSNSFMGLLQAKTGLVFDLPTEAQWEYACRRNQLENASGYWTWEWDMMECREKEVYHLYDDTCLTTALNNGMNLMAEETCPNMDMCGRYLGNGGNATYISSGTGGQWIGGTDEVGRYQVSGNGLKDMHGNVAEWCLDWYDTYELNWDDFGGIAVATDPVGPSYGLYGGRVIRGGGHKSYAKGCRAAARAYADASSRSSDIGFRVMCLPPPKKQDMRKK